MSKFTIPDKVLYVCTGSKCAKRGGKDLYKLAKSYIKHSHQKHTIEVVRTDCTDRCDYAPVCALQPGNHWVKEYRAKQIMTLLEEMEHQDKA
jgi:NADH:ubiquinone oxidoreductase subunit E